MTKITKEQLKKLPKKISLPAAKKLLPIDLNDLELNPREYKYIAVYCTNGFKGATAAAAAGYKRTSLDYLRSISWALQKRPHIIEGIKRFIDIVINPYKDRLEFEILVRYYNRATYKVTEFFDSDGTIKDLEEIDEEWIECIDGVETKYYGKEGSRKVVTYKLPNRDVALQMLLKMVTGGTGDPSLLPEESRKNLDAIFNNEYETRETITKRVTVEEIATREKKRGRPRKTPDKQKRTNKLEGVDK